MRVSDKTDPSLEEKSSKCDYLLLLFIYPIFKHKTMTHTFDFLWIEMPMLHLYLISPEAKHHVVNLKVALFESLLTGARAG